MRGSVHELTEHMPTIEAIARLLARQEACQGAVRSPSLRCRQLRHRHAQQLRAGGAWPPLVPARRWAEGQ